MITTFARKRLQDCCMFLKLATNDKRDRLQESYSLILMSETSAKAMKLNEGKKWDHLCTWCDHECWQINCIRKMTKSYWSDNEYWLEGSRVNYSMVVQRDCPKRKNILSLVIWIFDGEKRGAFRWKDIFILVSMICVTFSPSNIQITRLENIFTFWTFSHSCCTTME